MGENKCLLDANAILRFLLRDMEEQFHYFLPGMVFSLLLLLVQIRQSVPEKNNE